LPALENIIYGANLSNMLSAHKHWVLDVLAWLPYGILHFGAPFVCAAAIFLFAAPGTLRVYSSSFGYMNLIGVMIQLCFPCAPPWYESLYGMAPANYSMHGSPAGLARIDALFGLKMYTSTFTASPLVFGAMPSLHSGCATMEALFLAHVFPRGKWFFYSYVMWIWWSTLYLQHHYAVDLIAGSLLSGAVFYVAKTKFLARIQSDKEFRWDYDYLEIGSAKHAGEEIEMNYHSEDDEWTVGSSSGISSGCRSPVSPSDEIHSVWSSANSEVDAKEVMVREA
jgi:membrane-associated phospholipid phosphatase